MIAGSYETHEDCDRSIFMINDMNNTRRSMDVGEFILEAIVSFLICGGICSAFIGVISIISVFAKWTLGSKELAGLGVVFFFILGGHSASVNILIEDLGYGKAASTVGLIGFLAIAVLVIAAIEYRK